METQTKSRDQKIYFTNVQVLLRPNICLLPFNMLNFYLILMWKAVDFITLIYYNLADFNNIRLFYFS